VLGRIAAIGHSTFRECVRDRIFWLVGCFGLVLVACTTVLSPLTVGAQAKIVADVGLGAMALLGLLVVVLVGGSMVRKEIDRHTITTVLTKPVSRDEYLAGKFGGLALTLLAMLALMGALYLGALALTPGAGLGWTHLGAVYLTFLELLVLTAGVMLFSTVAAPALAGVLALALFAIGHLSDAILAFGEMAGPGLQRTVCRVLFYVVPNLEVFNVRAEVVHGDPVTVAHVGLATLYAVTITAAMLLVTRAVFVRKEL